jgi:hypothetical protein
VPRDIAGHARVQQAQTEIRPARFRRAIGADLAECSVRVSVPRRMIRLSTRSSSSIDIAGDLISVFEDAA